MTVRLNTPPPSSRAEREAARLQDVGHHQEERDALDGDAEQDRLAHERVVEAVKQGGERQAEQEEHEPVPPLRRRPAR